MRFTGAMLMVLVAASVGCSDIKSLDLKHHPEALAILVCGANDWDQDGSMHFFYGAAVCAQTRDGQYIVVTARHLAVRTPGDLNYGSIDPIFGNSIGLYDSLKPYISEIHDLP